MPSEGVTKNFLPQLPKVGLLRMVQRPSKRYLLHVLETNADLKSEVTSPLSAPVSRGYERPGRFTTGPGFGNSPVVAHPVGRSYSHAPIAPNWSW